MKIALKYSGQPVHSIEELFDRYGDKHFGSPLRSTVPSLAFWMDAERRVCQLCSLLNWNAPTECEIDYEHQVGPFGGLGKASHTDIAQPFVWRRKAERD
jgi:hypothetical protein